MYFPSLVYAEIGSVVLKQFKTSHYQTEDGQCKTDGNSDHLFALVSSDGVLLNKNTVKWSNQSECIYSLEFKSNPN